MLIAIDLGSSRPLYRQIAAGVEAALADGSLAPGDRLPPGRELAGTLGVNLETVQRAYRQLVADGIAVSRVGRGTRIVDDLDPRTVGVNTTVVAAVEAARDAGLGIDELIGLVRTRWTGLSGSASPESFQG